ncbi:hypothetical protein M409DRAFT_53702 [Zasmidium cellare ATCC 36951]|uniref:F-box domain-containing protein n=1 Tax=Zasmidium cellare ATCC 36951 TaxID=1080233 RepID=A0A6A6CNC4_ZASCE|nr:uncharacterized protein M409DRAFT_53702 [Zasmidium cellare ATCC 36951]KAF2167728.1 hypothetical protein M409DRAFT_53702 [Zasmidium cellare ATCC 36951]
MTTQTNTSYSARQQVFQATELMEHILLQLPWKDLFVCQSVSRQFRDAVMGSTLIQQKMFLLPVSPAPSSGLQICPALQRRPNRRRKDIFKHLPQEPEVICSIKPPTDGGDLTSSWSRLYLTNPPVKEIWAGLCWKVAGEDGAWGLGHYSGVRPIYDPEGFTIGKMLHATLRDERGRLDAEASWFAVGQEDEFMRGCGKKVLGVVEKLERSLGAKARFEAGTVRFLDTSM